MAVGLPVRLGDGDHVVRFYDDGDELAEVVVGYLADALEAGEAAVVIATADHSDLFRSGLIAAGVDVGAAGTDGRLVILDAATTLEQFMVGGRPDQARFDVTVGSVVRRAGEGGRRVRAFGEMVAVLWAAGDVASAIDVEGLWNELAGTVRFGLLCAYPFALVAERGASASFMCVCDAHSEVLGGAPVPAAYEVTYRFAGATDDPRRARHVVGETIAGWAGPEVIDDCVLVASELATNAVRHARSDFTLSLARDGEVIQITVGDASTDPPILAAAGERRVGGRGIGIVGRVASRWGHQVTGPGKLVWAHVPLNSRRDP